MGDASLPGFARQECQRSNDSQMPDLDLDIILVDHEVNVAGVDSYSMLNQRGHNALRVVAAQMQWDCKLPWTGRQFRRIFKTYFHSSFPVWSQARLPLVRSPRHEARDRLASLLAIACWQVS